MLVEDERVRADHVHRLRRASAGSSRERAPRKRVNLELGNATPVIVAADADLDDAATRLAANAFSFAGQSCISVQRIYVERAAYDDFVARFVPRVEALEVGDPADEETDVGPLIDDGARDRVLAWIEEARAAGAEILDRRRRSTDELLRPTVVANAAPDAKVVVRGGLRPGLHRRRRTTRSTRRSSSRTATRYGLQAGIFTRDVEGRARARRSELEFGGVTVNEAPTFRADQMPYGGVKDSGNTREGPAYAVREMTEERLVVIQL